MKNIQWQIRSTILGGETRVFQNFRFFLFLLKGPNFGNEVIFSSLFFFPFWKGYWFFFGIRHWKRSGSFVWQFKYTKDDETNLKVFTHLLYRISHTLMYADETVYAIHDFSSYCTEVTLFGCPPKVAISVPWCKSHTFTVLSLEALNSTSSVAYNANTALECPSAMFVQIRGDFMVVCKFTKIH